MCMLFRERDFEDTDREVDNANKRISDLTGRRSRPTMLTSGERSTSPVTLEGF